MASVPQVYALHDAVPAHFRALILLGGFTSLRWSELVNWYATVKQVGLPEGFHFHDLRHTGNQLAAEAGATTRELMRRMGHSTVRAAMRYQHSTDRRDRDIAAEMSKRAADVRGEEGSG